MWWEISLRRDVLVSPQRLEPSGGHRRWIIQKLLDDMDNLPCSRAHGYYIAPTALSGVSHGTIKESGSVLYTVDFKCLVFKLVRMEVVEMEVQVVARSGVEAACGPYDAIFIHHRLMPGFEFVNEDGPCFKKGDGQVISKGCAVRAKIIGMQFMGDGFRCLASLDADHLGAVHPQG